MNTRRVEHTGYVYVCLCVDIKYRSIPLEKLENLTSKKIRIRCEEIINPRSGQLGLGKNIIDLENLMS